MLNIDKEHYLCYCQTVQLRSHRGCECTTLGAIVLGENAIAEEAKVLENRSKYVLVWRWPDGDIGHLEARWTLRERMMFTEPLELAGADWALARYTDYNGIQCAASPEGAKEREILLLILQGYINPRATWPQEVDVPQSDFAAVHGPRLPLVS